MKYRHWLQFSTIIAGSQLRRNLTTSAAVNVANIVAGLVSYPVYLKYLSLQEYGVWIALSAVTSIVQLGGFGVGPAVTKYVAEERARDDVDAIQAYSSTAFALLSTFGVVIVIAATGARTAIADVLRLPTETYATAKHLVPLVALLSAYTFVTQVPSGTLAGLGRQDQVAYVQAAARLVTLVIAWVMLADGAGVLSLVVANLAGLVVTHVWTNALIRQALPRRRRGLVQFDILKMRKMIRFGAGVMGSGLMLMLLHPLNRIILSRYGGIALLPIFEIAYGGAMQVRSVFASAMTAMLPEFSRLDALGDLARARFLTRRLYRSIYIGALPLQLALLVLAPVALRVWLRSGFSWEQVLPFRIMLIGAFLSLLGVPGYYYLAAIARVRTIFESHAIQSIANMIVAATVLAILGHISAAGLSIAVSVGLAASTVWLLLDLRGALWHRNVP